MKKIFFVFVIILVSRVLFCQNIRGELRTPNIPFPDSILGYRAGQLYIEYIIDGYGNIISYHISSIRLFDPKTSKKKLSELDPFESIYNSRVPKVNTFEGIALVEKMKPWLDRFGKESVFIKDKGWDTEYAKKIGGVTDGYSLIIGSKKLIKEMKKKFKGPKVKRHKEEFHL